MRRSVPVGVRAVVVPTVACAIVCGGAVAALAAVGVRALAVPTAVVPAAPSLQPPAAVVVRTPPPPPVTDAPTATVWTVTFAG